MYASTLGTSLPIQHANTAAAIPDRTTRLETIAWIRSEFEHNRRLVDVVGCLSYDAPHLLNAKHTSGTHRRQDSLRA